MAEVQDGISDERPDAVRILKKIGCGETLTAYFVLKYIVNQGGKNV